MQISIEIKNHYGNELYYPACAKAQAFARIANSKTLTRDTLKAIQALNYKIEIVQPEVTF
mgnify:CR=1 FL=1|tara:strand:- start:344 stop:523 length:180 start_codon:yes stop_codon:yes gene_type:complete